ncbi:MAG TPA: BlaI/MecI/CopY family transcriptional regulator [Tepidisphaeraceae bacterium]|nr:BlaI/MecI/CopY family transcriptional regulator [Tepidisphaeraceae bacterium]
MASPRISEAEWEVMEVIWQRSPIVANEVVEQLVSHRAWAAATIKTMLNRLVKKGVLTYELQGKRYLYRPKVSREQCVRVESQTFLERVFSGAAGPMLNYFVQNTKLSRQEIAELRRILSEKEE